MTHLAPSTQSYARRQIVAYMGKNGYFELDGKRYTIWKIMTFYCGEGEPSIAAEFVRLADMDKEGFIRIENLAEGEMIVTPGLIYKKIPMSGVVMAEHMKKMKKFSPRALVQHVKDTSTPAEDLGAIDLRTDK